MYVDFFRLRELPFNNTPDPRFFVPTSDHEEALASLIYAVKQRKGFVLLTGEVGAGKTLVSRLMLRHFGSSIAFANINHGVQTGRDLLEAVCAEFELQVDPHASLTQLVRSLHDFLLERFAQDVPVVLVLDEAQNLPVDAFEQLRMIGNLEADDAKLLQIAIVGQPELQTLFASRELRQLRQRIFRSFHLPALHRKNTEDYIRHRLVVAGAENPDLFDAEAIDRIQTYTGGLPRLINTLCDNAMLSAYSADRKTIDGPFVESVIEQLMQTEDADSDATGGPWTGAAVAVEARDASGMHMERIADSETTAGRIASRSPGPVRPNVIATRTASATTLTRPVSAQNGQRVGAERPHLPISDREAGGDGLDRAHLIRSARRELDALRTALHGPLRSNVSAPSTAHRAVARDGIAVAHDRSDSIARGLNAAPGSHVIGAANARASEVVMERDPGRDAAESRLRTLVEQAERSSVILQEREEKLRVVVGTVEGLAANLRGLLQRYHQTVGATERTSARSARALEQGRNVRMQFVAVSERVDAAVSVAPPSETRRSAPVRTDADRTADGVTPTPTDPKTVAAAGAAIRARRLAKTLRATRENLARLRTLAVAKR